MAAIRRAVFSVALEQEIDMPLPGGHALACDRYLFMALRSKRVPGGRVPLFESPTR